MTRAEVVDVAAALKGIDEPEFRSQYFTRTPKDSAPEYVEEDYGYAWEYFRGVAELHANAARGRAVLFTVRQQGPVRCERGGPCRCAARKHQISPSR